MKHSLLCLGVVFFIMCGCRQEPGRSLPKTEIPEVQAEPGLATDLTTPDVDVALNFINGYIDNCNKKGEAVGVVEWVEANPLATDNYKAALKKEYDDAEMIDADMVFDTQDFDDEGMEVASVDDEGYVVLQGISWKEFKVTVNLVKVDGKWLVDGCGNINIPQERRRLN